PAGRRGRDRGQGALQRQLHASAGARRSRTPVGDGLVRRPTYGSRMAEHGKEIPASIFADDDGSADAVLAQALIRHASGRAPLSDVVEALTYARVLVPVMASGEQRIIGKHG